MELQRKRKRATRVDLLARRAGTPSRTRSVTGDRRKGTMNRYVRTAVRCSVIGGQELSWIRRHMIAHSMFGVRQCPLSLRSRLRAHIQLKHRIQVNRERQRYHDVLNAMNCHHSCGV